MTYKEFDKFPIEARKRQIEAAFRLGVTNEKMSKSMLEAHEEHKKNADALERTLVIFRDFPPTRMTIRRLQERLTQEKLWVEHYDRCVAEHKRGRERLTELMKGLDLKVVVDVIVRKDQDEKRKERPVEEPKPKKKDGPVQMIAKMLVPGAPSERKLRGAARRRFFMERRAN